MNLPLRTGNGNFELWEGSRGGDLQVVATDHCPFDFKSKKDMFGRDDYKKIPQEPGNRKIIGKQEEDSLAVENSRT